MDNTILRKLQFVQLEIMDEFVRICEKHKFSYFFTGGTALGALRHKGFIPWDDDIDLGMPRIDYENFIRISDTELDNKYYVHCIQKNENAIFSFIKICKRNTISVKHDIKNLKHNLGISIDIFPYDNAINFTPILFLQKTMYRIFSALVLYKMDTEKKDTKARLVRTIAKPFPLKTLQTLRQMPLLLFKNFNTTCFVQWTGTYSYNRETFKKTDFYPLIKIEFEGKQYNCPWNLDSYLTQMYGDYMKLPPKNERTSHDPVLIVFNTTVEKDYAANL
jgi:lipopolysaccharide cholinephosphotransferase